jgi:cytidylate kinase
MDLAPVIAIDGPTASGKGTVAQRVAAALGWHYLDSGALYRLVALRALELGIDAADASALAELARQLKPEFRDGRIVLDGRDVTEDIRREDVGTMASKVAALAPLRAALLDLQKGCRRFPGLVADGRDMGTVVFPDAQLKVFLTATAEARAERRYKQLKEKGFSSNIGQLLQDLRARDERDSSRSAAPLKPAEDARQLDSSNLTIDEVAARILSWHGKG